MSGLFNRENAFSSHSFSLVKRSRGLSTGPLLDIVIRINPGLIATTFFGTSTVFACFSLASLYAADGKFLCLGGTLLSVCSTLFWMALFNIFFGSYFVYQVNLYLGLTLMCGFVLYDTQSIVEKCRMGDTDYVYHSMNLFIDFIGMFTRLLIILTQKEDRKKKNRD
ncbi:unnamed protein product [Soboliphyme baturini]|uniref:Bax inhibitor 1 n=1 Tax=Soboliphyme baturini TaxID=241478 RepID=A0A183ID34_9BILA|nr:unnamed protein product [Soboliphyme baturini]